MTAWKAGVLRAMLALAAACGWQAALAQDYPARPVRIIVPFGPGSGSDVMARLFADELQKALGGTFIVENRAGASGIIAAEAVAKSTADGYTLLMTSNTTHSANPGLFKSLPYDPVKDFAPGVPTLRETILPDLRTAYWGGMFAPAGTNREILARLHAALNKTLARPDTVERLSGLGAVPRPVSLEEFGTFVREQVEIWGKSIREAGIERQ